MRCLTCRRNGLPKATEKCPTCGAVMASLLHDMLPSGTLLNRERYRIDYPLGRGGFGITYRAFDTTFNIVVVIKEFFPEGQAMRKDDQAVVVPNVQHSSYEKALKHFLGEARILAKLSKENVVRVFDYFKSHDTAYIVMEMIEGRTLRELLDERPEKCFPPDEVEKIVDQMVDALEVIHLNGVFHLDISPDNVMQTKAGKIVLIDFGAARQSLITNESYSGGGHQQFKQAYAPSEIVAENHVGPQSDLFELAMMTHELLSGTLPPSFAQRVATDDGWKPQLADERWQKLIERALPLKKEDRPESVRKWWNDYHRPRIHFGSRTPKGVISEH